MTLLIFSSSYICGYVLNFLLLSISIKIKFHHFSLSLFSPSCYVPPPLTLMASFLWLLLLHVCIYIWMHQCINTTCWVCFCCLCIYAFRAHLFILVLITLLSNLYMDIVRRITWLETVCFKKCPSHPESLLCSIFHFSSARAQLFQFILPWPPYH